MQHGQTPMEVARRYPKVMDELEMYVPGRLTTMKNPKLKYRPTSSEHSIVEKLTFSGVRMGGGGGGGGGGGVRERSPPQSSSRARLICRHITGTCVLYGYKDFFCGSTASRKFTIGHCDSCEYRA